MNREEFLSTFWQPYPPMPPGAEAFGRIESISAEQVKLVNGDSFAVPSRLGPLSKFQASFPVGEILQAGDNIAILKDEIWLLTPCLDPQFRLGSSPAILKKWSEFLGKVRSFFQTRDFLEVATPTFVDCPGTEPFLHPFSVQLNMGSETSKKFLPTSPELHLKKYLAGGYLKVFEMRSCFRDQEFSEHHEPEFMMLEWYRAFATHADIEQDLRDLLAEFYQGEILKISVAELFKKHCDFELHPDPSEEELRALALKMKLAGAKILEQYSFQDLFARIFIDIEKHLPKDQPVIVHSYPAACAAYSRIGEGGWADRFELYWKGLEIANAFHEVNDPLVQVERMQNDLDLREKNQFTALQLDAQFIAALEGGMPPSGGIALGLERLFMAANDHTAIQVLRPFSKGH